MFISFDPHPLWMCHHLASSLRRCPTQVHGVMCFQPQASRMRLCAVCPPRVAWMQQQNTQSDRGSFTPARRCASYVLRCLVPTSFAGAQRIILLSGSASFFSVVRPSLVRAAHTRGGGNVRDVVLRRTSQSPCLVDSERPMTVHPVMGKTPSQIGQTSLSVLSTWVQYPPLHG